MKNKPMKAYDIITLSEHPGWRLQAAHWFHEKWKVPQEEYLASISESLLSLSPVPQWYIAVEGQQIIAGAGVIENDFHNRKDLTPNVCALYVEWEWRCRGIAGDLLASICNDMSGKGISTIYLITKHTVFYERYGWDFLCTVQSDDGEPMRMYQKRLFEVRRHHSASL